MLLLEPFWVFASASFCVACCRNKILECSDIWSNRYFTTLILLTTIFFTPFENWILIKHIEWETTFLVEDGPGKSVIGFAAVLHIATLLCGYRFSIFMLQWFGPAALVRASIFSYTIFFSSQGVFCDTLLYSGTYAEYHAGVHKDMTSFFFTQRFIDAYVLFFLTFGPPFFYTAYCWHKECSEADRKWFGDLVVKESIVQGCAVCGIYFLLALFGFLPANHSCARTFIVAFMNFSPLAVLVYPFKTF